jgi:hypothetical protein
MYLISMSPFSTWSLSMWCLLSMCLILLWKTRFFGYRDGTGIVAHEGNYLKDHSKISHDVHNPQDLAAATSSSYILSLCGGLYNWRLFLRRPANKRRSEKMSSTRSTFLVNPTTHKISIKKANKIKRRRSRIPNSELKSVFEVPEDSLNCCPMRGEWEAWKHAQRHTVNWMSDHVTMRYRRETIMLLYSLWSTASSFSSGSYKATVLIGVDTGLSSSMLNFFIRSFVYLAWCMNVHCFVCLTWIPKKNVSYPIMDIWNSFSIIFWELDTREWNEPLKIISSTYI